jgi:hypothetical protein
MLDNNVVHQRPGTRGQALCHQEPRDVEWPSVVNRNREPVANRLTLGEHWGKSTTSSWKWMNRSARIQFPLPSWGAVRSVLQQVAAPMIRITARDTKNSLLKSLTWKWLERVQTGCFRS